MPNKIEKIRPGDEGYPLNLAAIKNPPILYVRGAGLGTDRLGLAGIGSRDVSKAALRRISQFVEQLVKVIRTETQIPLVIISGLAWGVDAEFHRLALELEVPTTGVLPTPINRMYPKENLWIVQAILEKKELGNAVISEYPPIPDGQVAKRNPLQRNTIVALLPEVVLLGGVSRVRSGSLNTARTASREGRPVFFIRDTVSASVRAELLGNSIQAVEVLDPKEVVEVLAQ